MRMMMKFTVPVEKGNAAFKDGTLAKTVEGLMSKMKPEAAYFTTSNGMRGGMIFFDMKDPSEVVEYCEPLMLNVNAAVEFVPVMTGDDLHKGFTKVE